MGYKLLYIEDSNPNSIMKEFNNQGFNIEHHDPHDFEQVLESINADYVAIILDFRLSSKHARFDAPTIASSIRTRDSIMHRDIPIFLMSSEENITGYYRDFTSQDLFDFVIEKEKFRKHPEDCKKIIEAYISAYSDIKEKKFNIAEILNITQDKYSSLGYRFINQIQDETLKSDSFATISFIRHELLDISGPLIDEDVLSARLGIDKYSTNWDKLLKKLAPFKYKGVLNSAFPRWWMDEINSWWKANIDGEKSMRRFNAGERTKKISEILKIEGLNEIKKPKYSKSTKYWFACSVTGAPLDSVDGLELYIKELHPWQDNLFLSIDVGLDPSAYLPEGEKYKNKLKPNSKIKLKQIAQKLNEE